VRHGFNKQRIRSWLIVSLVTVAIVESPFSTVGVSDDKVTRAASSQLDAFLAQHCVKCHGSKNQEGDLALHLLKVSNPRPDQAEVWMKVFDKLDRLEMPPEDAPQPSAEERKNAITSVKKKLREYGVTVDDTRWQHPSRGNWVDHDALFSGKATGPAQTRGRLWRLTGDAYFEFLHNINLRYRLSIRTYGHHRIRPPWGLGEQDGLRDYAFRHRIGESEIEHHLRNATKVARLMIARLPKSRVDPELGVFLKSGESFEPKQLQATTRVAFTGLLGRPPTSDEVERYSGFLQSNLKTFGEQAQKPGSAAKPGSSPTERALEQQLIAILFHPEVMYRIELPAEGAKRSLMPPRELARSIAYALTDREPDAELLKAAEEGQLKDRSGVNKQVTRLLADEEIERPRILRFFQEYFGYTKAIDVFKDEATRKAAGFRGRNDWHPNFFVSDTDRLVQWIVDRDEDVFFELLTTPETFAVTGTTKQADGVKKNAKKPFSLFAQTALDIYELKIERKDWSDERPFEMPSEHRMGILTHPSWLIAHSTNFENHAIHRGRWIRERLLGGHIPEIPVTVDAQLPDEPDKPLRERMRVTREEYCWKCHRQMDPLGLPFEQFDHFGRFRTAELTQPVDTSGSVEEAGSTLDGPVTDPFQLLRKLARSKRVEQVFVRYTFRYFLGRNETLADGPTLVAAHRAYTENGGSMKALIASLLSSDAFLYRTEN
jgi:hypothetical protein